MFKVFSSSWSLEEQCFDTSTHGAQPPSKAIRCSRAHALANTPAANDPAENNTKILIYVYEFINIIFKCFMGCSPLNDAVP